MGTSEFHTNDIRISVGGKSTSRKTKLALHIQSILFSCWSTGFIPDKYTVLGAVDSDSGSVVTA